MIVTKKKYEEARELADLRKESSIYWESMYTKASYSLGHSDRCLTAAENALNYKEGTIDDLQAEVYELHVTVKCMNGNSDSQGKLIRSANERVSDLEEQRKWMITERDEAEQKAREALAAQHRAEAALAAATRISYVVALHINDVPALPRYTSLDDAYGEFMEATSPDIDERNAGIHRVSLYRIFVLKGDEVIADVTDSTKWDETLPVSKKRSGLISIGDLNRALVAGPKWMTANGR